MAIRKRCASSPFVARVSAGAIGFATLLACANAPEQAQNAILISVDTLRADHMGMYGYERDATPHLDRFFARGTVFDQAVSPAPCTLPAVPQVLAGAWVVENAQPSLAELLAEAGVATAAVASQHQFRQGSEQSSDAFALAASVPRGFEHFDLQAIDAVDDHGFSTRSAREVTDRALAWLDERDPTVPFFLWVHYFDPHDPYEPPETFRRFGANDPSSRDGDRRRDLVAAAGPGLPWQRAGHIFDERDVARLVDLYDGEILYTDAEIGRLLDELERTGLVDRSIVAFFSDHGEWLGEGDRWDHCRTLRDVELHVPLAVVLNGGRLDEHAHVLEPVTLLDLAPTVLAAVGLDAAGKGYDGRDLRNRDAAAPVFAAWRGLAAARQRDWKLLYDRGRPTGLYAVASDPDERRNRLGEGIPEEARLLAHIERFVASEPGLRAQNRETLERLRALGYAE